MYEYMADVVRVVDGDTVDLRVDLGFGITFKERFRLHGINAPEIHGVKKDSEEYKAGMEATNWLRQKLEHGRFQVRTIKDKKGKYGRYLAVLIERDGSNINDEMVKLGYAEAREY